MWLQLSTFVLYLCCSTCAGDELVDIPSDFSLGASTSALQVEGGWNASGKGESVWDRYYHENPLSEEKGVNIDVTADSYHKYKEDVQLLRELGLNHYRFSISWTRVLPTGYANVTNPDGIQYYHNLLDELEKYNITPYVTLFHFDHPQVFEDLGGWVSEEIIELYAEYARVIFQEFGHRVKVWGTINEPTIYCKMSYQSGSMPPALSLGLAGYYKCITNTIKAHARAYHIYDDEFRATQNGKIGIVQHCGMYYATNESDTEAVELSWQYDCGLVGHPIFSEDGDFYPEIRRRIAVNSAAEGLSESRLPTLSEYWINYIKGSSDFLGLIHYLVSYVESSSNTTYYENEIGVTQSNSGGSSQGGGSQQGGQGGSQQGGQGGSQQGGQGGSEEGPGGSEEEGPGGSEEGPGGSEEEGPGGSEEEIPGGGSSGSGVPSGGGGGGGSSATPEAMLDLLVKIKEEYNIPVYILESGTQGDDLEDTSKAEYIYEYLNATLVARESYGVDVRAFTVWSLIDTFELSRGYSSAYGLIDVDFDSDNRTRTIRTSGKWYGSVATSRKLQEVSE